MKKLRRKSVIVLFFLLLSFLAASNSCSNRDTIKEDKVEAKESVEVSDDGETIDEEEDDYTFMGEEGEDEVDLSIDSPAYLKDKRELFVDPALRLGTKPLRLTLEDCIRIAVINNNKVQATEYGIDAAKARHDEASARFWPIFEYEWLSAPIPHDVSHAVGNFFTGNLSWWNKFKIGMGMPVYAFGKMSIAQELAKSGITAARAVRAKEKLSTVTSVRQLYYGVLLAEELGRLLIKAHEKLSKAIENEEEGKEKSPIDKIRAKVFLVDLEKRLAEAREKELLALEGLRVQLGLNPDVAVMVYSNRLKPVRTELRPEKDYIETAYSNRPDVRLVEVGVDARRNQYKLEKRKFLPDVGVGAYFDAGRSSRRIQGLTTTDNYSNPFNFTRAGIGVRVEGQFDVHGQKARVKRARSDYYKASLEHYMAKDGIGLEVKKSYMEAKRALADIERAEKAERLSRQLLFFTESNYELGVGEKDEYTDALQLVLVTRGKYFEAVFNYNVALAVLDDKAGIIPDIGTQVTYTIE